MASHSEKLAQLVEMGFERGKAEDALKRSSGNIDQAMGLLLNIDDHDAVPALIPADDGPKMPSGEANVIRATDLPIETTGIPVIPSNSYGSYANPSGSLF